MKYYNKLRDLVLYRGEIAPDIMNHFNVDILKNNDTADMCNKEESMDYYIDMYPPVRIVVYNECGEWKIRDGYIGPLHMDYRLEEEIISAYILQELGIVEDIVETYSGSEIDELKTRFGNLLEAYSDIFFIRDLHKDFCLKWKREYPICPNCQHDKVLVRMYVDKLKTYKLDNVDNNYYIGEQISSECTGDINKLYAECQNCFTKFDVSPNSPVDFSTHY